MIKDIVDYMKKFNIYLTFFQLCLLLLPGAHLEADTKSDFTPVDRWYEVYLGGSKVGYVSDMMQKDGDVIKSRNEFVMQIKRAGQSIEITVEQETREELSGELIDFSSETKMAGIPMLKRVGWKGRNWSFMKNNSLRVRKSGILLTLKEP